MALTCISQCGIELHPEHGKLLAGLTIAAVKHLGDDTLLVDADNRLRKLQMVRVDEIVLIDQPADDTGPRCINCYLVTGEKTFKLDPQRLLYSLQWLQGHAAGLPFPVTARPRQWFDFVSLTLLAELSRCDPQLRDRLRVG